uniref:Putative secreted cysteine and threonine rich salivary protein n=1 Tax=Ixodes scapularis TaxID=6945 RepID=Q4PMJ9_IXOSC|nr:putative secreted cysteine and threonine rich salivary protein [Ixodes scapularis]
MSGIELILLLFHISIVYGAEATQCNSTKVSCPRLKEEWHFNGLIGRCERSTRSFCGGNDNKFSTFEECQRICENQQIITPEDCRMDLNRGICEHKKKGRPLKAVYRWYFNSTDSKCYRFMWHRCSANRNNFPTKQDCMICERAMPTTLTTPTTPTTSTTPITSTTPAETTPTLEC